MTWHSDYHAGIPQHRPVAVVDIGSNSVRLVVYDGLRRSPVPIFNEKLLCGLGKGVAITGKLSDIAMARALATLRRFRALCQQIKVENIFALATAAVREASNGQYFIAEAQQALGSEITILMGKEEAHLAALGVLASMAEVDGIVGDLGGGSLELTDIKNGVIQEGFTLPIGPLRLIDLSGGSIDDARKIIDDHFEQTELMAKLKGRRFYAVGGTWRNLARLHMAQIHYPLQILHGYKLTHQQVQSVVDSVVGLSSSELKDIGSISKSRSETLPYGALILRRLLAYGNPRDVTMSVYGVREGLLYDQLSEHKRAGDALLASCWDYACRHSRSSNHELELCDWSDQLFNFEGLLCESKTERRLRYAACLLADIGWLSHPDYRAELVLSMISQAAFVGLDHAERVFLALTVYYRYDGKDSISCLWGFLEESAVVRARLLSALFRLAYVLSAAMPGLLPRIRFSLSTPKILTLILPRELGDLAGERVEKHLNRLAAKIGRVGNLTIEF